MSRKGVSSQALNISLPQATAAAGDYAPFVQAGNLVFLAGHTARNNGEPWGRSVWGATCRSPKEKKRRAPSPLT